MKEKRLTAFFLSIFFLIGTFGNIPLSTITAADLPVSYQIDETTSIKNDFYHLGIERVQYKNLSDILRSELVAMLDLDSTLYLYLAMPEDSTYQVNNITINDQKYSDGIRLLATDHNYRKYSIPDFMENASSQYTISEIGFQNPEGKNICYTALFGN